MCCCPWQTAGLLGAASENTSVTTHNRSVLLFFFFFFLLTCAVKQILWIDRLLEKLSTLSSERLQPFLAEFFLPFQLSRRGSAFCTSGTISTSIYFFTYCIALTGESIYSVVPGDIFLNGNPLYIYNTSNHIRNVSGYNRDTSRVLQAVPHAMSNAGSRCCCPGTTTGHSVFGVCGRMACVWGCVGSKQ